MPLKTQERDAYTAPMRRLTVSLFVLCLLAIFVFWRIDGPRAEWARMQVIDRVVPHMAWVSVPVTEFVGLVRHMQSYAALQRQNQELRDEIRQMKAWREAALQLEQENAKLLDLNFVRIDPKLIFVSGRVLADGGSPHSRSLLLNVGGARDGIRDGWAVTDGLGLVGRVLGVGETTSRVLLLTDPRSRVPVTLQPSGQRAILAGDNSDFPVLEFVESPEEVQPGDRVVSSGDGSVFPAGLPVGRVLATEERRMRLQLIADYGRLAFLRVLRSDPPEVIDAPAELIGPLRPVQESAEGWSNG